MCAQIKHRPRVSFRPQKLSKFEQSHQQISQNFVSKHKFPNLKNCER